MCIYTYVFYLYENVYLLKAIYEKHILAILRLLIPYCVTTEKYCEITDMYILKGISHLCKSLKKFIGLYPLKINSMFNKGMELVTLQLSIQTIANR